MDDEGIEMLKKILDFFSLEVKEAFDGKWYFFSKGNKEYVLLKVVEAPGEPFYRYGIGPYFANLNYAEALRYAKDMLLGEILSFVHMPKTGNIKGIVENICYGCKSLEEALVKADLLCDGRALE